MAKTKNRKSFLLFYRLLKSGRKWTQIIVTLGMAVTAYAYGSSTAVIFVIVFGFLFQIFQTSQAAVCSIYVPELWPTNVELLERDLLMELVG